jgi:tRNA1(Val) A37 N6-methylase TrmN6
MKVGELEKLVLNSSNHGQHISSRDERLLRYINLEPGQKYLDVGTGNGATPIYMAQKYGQYVFEVIHFSHLFGLNHQNLAEYTHDSTQKNSKHSKFEGGFCKKILPASSIVAKLGVPENFCSVAGTGI